MHAHTPQTHDTTNAKDQTMGQIKNTKLATQIAKGARITEGSAILATLIAKHGKV